MKRCLALVCCCMLVFLGLPAWAAGQITVEFAPHSLSEGTARADGQEYPFAYDVNGELTITYPNGYTYTRQEESLVIMESWPYDQTAEEMGYADGRALAEAIQQAAEAERQATGSSRRVPLVVPILLLGVGAWHVVWPLSLWWLERGWWYKNAQPSDGALMLYRLLGCFLVFLGILALLAG